MSSPCIHFSINMVSIRNFLGVIVSYLDTSLQEIGFEANCLSPAFDLGDFPTICFCLIYFLSASTAWYSGLRGLLCGTEMIIIKHNLRNKLGIKNQK